MRFRNDETSIASELIECDPLRGDFGKGWSRNVSEWRDVEIVYGLSSHVNGDPETAPEYDEEFY